MQKRDAGNYFHFTRKERNGTIVLLGIILLLTVTPYLYQFVIKEKKLDKIAIQNELLAPELLQNDSVTKEYARQDHNKYQGQYRSSSEKFSPAQVKGTLFYFDPNTIPATGWKKLGVRDKTINTIQNFLAKGGKFREPSDIKKIWGFHEDETDRLIPFIRIEQKENFKKFPAQTAPFNKYEAKKIHEPIDINEADTTAWIRLPGIGSKLSGRITSFRDKLGGFYRIEQVAETFGLPDSVFQRIRPLLMLGNKNIRQVNINTASVDELKQHPYIRYQLATLVVQYRSQHGNYSSISDLKKIMTVTDELFNKLSPYLQVE